jgi:hypothetical protein
MNEIAGEYISAAPSAVGLNSYSMQKQERRKLNRFVHIFGKISAGSPSR